MEVQGRIQVIGKSMEGQPRHCVPFPKTVPHLET